jgi:hypothetical protein
MDADTQVYLDTVIERVFKDLDTPVPTVNEIETMNALHNQDVNTAMTTIEKLDTSLEDDGSSGYQFTDLALENGPAGDNTAVLDAIAALNDPSTAEIVSALSGQEIVIIADSTTSTYMEVIQGRDYDDVAHTKRRITIGGTPDLTGGTVTMTVRDDSGTLIATITGELENEGTSSQTIALPIAAADFAGQRTGRRYMFDVTVTISGSKYTPALGTFNLIEGITA